MTKLQFYLYMKELDEQYCFKCRCRVNPRLGEKCILDLEEFKRDQIGFWFDRPPGVNITVEAFKKSLLEDCQACYKPLK